MMHRTLIKLLLPVLVVVCMSPAQAETLAQQRQTYQLALLALKAGQDQVFEYLKAQLEDYPLYPYLIYEELKRRLSVAPDAEVQDFLQTYAGTPLADQMRGLWLYKFYQQDRWQKFLEVYDGRAITELMCYDLRARVRAEHLEGVIERTKKLWLVGYSQHSACDRLFEWFETQPEFTPELIWKRIELAVHAGNPGLAGYLARRLNEPDRAWVMLWQRMYGSPQTTLKDPALNDDSLLARKILIHGILRLADRDVEQGKVAWEGIRSDYDFDPEQRDAVDRSIALLAAYRHHPQASDWLQALPESALNDDVHTWQARTAIRNGDWQALKHAIEALKDTSEEPYMWRYWHARALEQIGAPETAHALYTTLARERDYYGFLAADRLGVSYSMNNEPLVQDTAAVGALMALPGIQRAYELLRVGAETEARREWNSVISHLDEEQIKLAAVLASKWGWHSDAIRMVALIEQLDDLEVRFPTPYRDEVMHAAKLRKLEPAWIYGVMRRESAFAARAASPAGALGLMQLMPATASITAQRFGLPAPAGNDIFDPARNIQLGSAYLRELLERFGSNQALASAAYNAGPHRVERWLPEHGALPADAWVETIPFYETRGYVQAVMAYTAVYEWKLGNRPTPLAKRMELIPPAGQEYANQ